MKRIWEKTAFKIDALSLRERTVVFVMLALLLTSFFNFVVIGPRAAKQKQLSGQMKQDRDHLAQIQQQIQEKTFAQKSDPDAANRKRLEVLLAQISTMQESMHDVQKRLVAPDKMAEVLETILKRNGKLRLVSMRTLAVAGLNDSSAAEGGTAEKAAAPARDKSGPDAGSGSIYKHGVELTVQGSYLDMVNYMTELEAMPWQLFWGKAKLDVVAYPKATLTLTLFTLSLDKKWLNI